MRLLELQKLVIGEIVAGRGSVTELHANLRVFIKKRGNYKRTHERTWASRQVNKNRPGALPTSAVRVRRKLPPGDSVTKAINVLAKNRKIVFNRELRRWELNSRTTHFLPVSAVADMFAADAAYARQRLGDEVFLLCETDGRSRGSKNQSAAATRTTRR